MLIGRRRYDTLKRAMDITGALILLIAFFPVLAVTWLLVRTFLGSPALFRQARPGRGAKPFDLIKYRSMTNARDAHGALLPDAQRLTRFGRILRATSLDELPQLWNVVKGDMSLVGPRPLLIHYVPIFTAEQSRRHEVRPGLMGWAQINGRNNIDWEQRLAMDVCYVDNRSLRLDVKIIFKSIAMILRGSGIAQEGCATMTEFTGSPAGQNVAGPRRQ
jgi:lipopolysaccharide/colanic/teichoic acid biosynthesis glycosyltransferase